MVFVLMVAGIIFAGQSVVMAQESGANVGLLEKVEKSLKEKIVHSGTLDIYDEKINKVRNLRLIEFQKDTLEGGGATVLLADFRDIQTGEIVVVEMDAALAGGEFELGNMRIKEVKALVKAAAAEDKEYTDEEIQEVMTGYLDQQGQFNDGKVMLFDPENAVMRNLQLKELKKEVRRLGIFYSSSSQFTDAGTGDILDVDISVQKKSGKLKVQALRIRNVRKGGK